MNLCYYDYMKKNRILLIIDIQMDYFPGGKMELDSPDLASQNAGRLLDFFRKNDIPVIHIRHESVHSDAKFLKQGTSGTDFHPDVHPREGEFVVAKNYPNSFRDTLLGEILDKYDNPHLVICGMMTHMCVSSTVRAAWDLGYGVTLIHDACATRPLKSVAGVVDGRSAHVAHISALERFATIQSVEDFLLE